MRKPFDPSELDLRRRVLVIDDDDDVREVLSDVLEAEGYETVGASDGGVGLTIAQEWAPDVILLDLMLPTLSGREVAERLRTDPRTAHIPIVVVSASESALPGDVPPRGRAGGDDDDGPGAAGAVASLVLRSGRAVVPA